MGGILKMDLDAIKSRLNAMQKTSNGNGGERASLFWKPTVGKQTIRVRCGGRLGAASGAYAIIDRRDTDRRAKAAQALDRLSA